MAHARFITLEGVEGAGKSTHLPRIAEWLRQQGQTVRTTREPGGTAVGEAIRAILLDSRYDGMTVETEALLMYAARAQHLAEVIRPALAAGTWVLSDRFVDASYAYQGAARGLSEARLDVLTAWTLEDLQPDLTLLFDLPVSESRRRLAGRTATVDRFEQEDEAFFERVRQAYLDRARRAPERYRVIDATQPREDVERQWKAALTPLLPS